MSARRDHNRNGFSLVELLVAIAIILVLMALMGAAVSAARSGAKIRTSTSSIAKLDQVIMTQFRKYESRRQDVSQIPSGITRSAFRAWKVRRNMITGDMVDRWTDVAFMAANPQEFDSPSQKAYIATWNAAATKPTNQYGGAECLFMIIMQGGFADCLDCDSLAKLKKGDKDSDGAFEFWDDWDNPIDYILWAPGFEKSASPGEKFFTNLDDAFPAAGAVRPALGMRPVIYSAGPDGEYGLERNSDQATLSFGSGPIGRDCGNPAATPISRSGGPASDAAKKREDNVVNIEMEVQS